ncbi:unnamed protein product [Ectocarpus sp. CCAP 1310/34]|nr:unnamed protein product [Ectocarpus sp. CCAP 1310/34]
MKLEVVETIETGASRPREAATAVETTGTDATGAVETAETVALEAVGTAKAVETTGTDACEAVKSKGTLMPLKRMHDGRNDGGDSSSDSAADDRKRSREELVALRTQVSSLTDQMSQIMSLVEDTMKASKKEEPAGTMAMLGREPPRSPRTPKEGTVDRECAGREVRVAAAHNQDYSSAMGDGGAAVGFGYGATTPATGYQSVRYTSPPFSGKSKDFNEWLNDFRMAANGANLLEQFEESGSLEIPVNSGKSKFSLSQQYRSEQVELAFHAWNFLSHALKDKDRKIMKKVETPQGALRELKTIHDPESSVQPSEDLKSLKSTKISRGENSQNALNEMLQTAKSFTGKGLTVNETFVLHLFLDALSDEYAMTKHNLRHAKELTRTGVLKEVMIEYKAIKDKLEQGKGKGAKGAEQAYFADGEGRRERYSSRSQGQGRGRGGGRGRSSSRGRGGGGRGDGGGGRGGRSGGSGGVEESKGSSSGGADGGGGGDY